ncbi:MAG: aldehyde ferredoxin oxidoreductase N-terminal domain-containing protein [Coriobacteriia bacterium]
MSNGYAGKIISLDLTTRTVELINTSKYSEDWVGGIQFGVAAFWDAVDKGYLSNIADKSGFEPENVVCLMTGPLGGTPTPGAGRTEVCGVAPQSYPRPLFSRGNFGGRFSPMLKFAGYDGIVVKGRADKPVWVKIVDDSIEILDAEGLWGLDVYEVQEEINRSFSPEGYGEWIATAGRRRTTQRPATVTIGPAGENMVRTAILAHDMGAANGQGGFGGVFGSKNLKAITVMGTGTVRPANAEALLEARIWLKQYSLDPERPGTNGDGYAMFFGAMEPGRHEARRMGSKPGTWGDDNFERPAGCYGCDKNCKPGFKNGRATELQCVEALVFSGADAKLNGKTTELTPLAAEWLQRVGLNAYDGNYVALVTKANAMGILGSGMKVDTDLDFTKSGTFDFFKEVARRTAYREEIGNDLAEGYVRCTSKWGMLEEDLKTGSQYLYNIGQIHHGHAPYWAFESLFQVRDINSHQMHIVEGVRPGFTIGGEGVPLQSPTQEAERVAELAAPWHDPLTADSNAEHIYDLPMARMIAFHKRYIRGYLNAATMCDWDTPSWFNNRTDDGKGISPEYETKFLNAVTGRDLSFEDGLELGRKCWNFERAILCLMDKHRDEEYFPPYPPYDSWLYDPKATKFLASAPDGKNLLSYKGGKWIRENTGAPLDRAKHDELKTIYYELEGWDTSTGRPTRKTLEECGLSEVADVLESEGKLGN